MSHKKLSKHDIKEDNFITFVLESWEFVRVHQNKFFTGLIVLVVIIASMVWMNNSRQQASESAEMQFAEAVSSFRNMQFKSAEEMFKIVNERYSSMKEGIQANYFIGKCALLEGRNSDAIESFEKYLEDADKYPFFRDAAMDGMATAYENERNYEKAAELYVKLAGDLRTNTFMEASYLKKAAENFRMSNQSERAIEVLESLLEKTSGTDRRDIEIELDILKG